MEKRLFTLMFAFLILISLVADASAITGRMGNSRMVLNLDIKEEAQRYILVQNVNEVPLTIEMAPSGDLKDNVDLEETEFTLEPGEEKRAYFTIYADESGTTETKINVMFKPPQGNGVGLSASVIVVAGNDSENEDQNDELPEEQSERQEDTTQPNNSESENSISPITILTLSTIALILIFVALLIFTGKQKVSKKKRSRRPRE